MKKIIVFLAAILVVTGFAFGQKVCNEDEKARIGTFVKLFPEVFNVNITSLEAKSVADVITHAFTSFYLVPVIPMTNIHDASEIAELQRMVDNLNFLLTNPPSWEQLVNLQTKQKSTPQTPPVFAGEAAAIKYYNSTVAETNRNMQGKNPVLIEQVTSSDETKVPQPKSE
ncbi:MAG TPA: hypothetical protein PLZ52_06565 [Bacteroidales bacterium]|nr:hypothetical protein [Bacteroidales bacterium]HQL69671.1 hypothetical protein [Bacteroidales bacterium]